MYANGNSFGFDGNSHGNGNSMLTGGATVLSSVYAKLLDVERMPREM